MLFFFKPIYIWNEIFQHSSKEDTNLATDPDPPPPCKENK